MLRALRTVVAFGLTAGLALSASAQERELQAIANDIAIVRVKVQTLVSEFSKGDVVDVTRRFSERLTDAEILFLLRDYQRASLLLFDLVEDPKNHNEPKYSKALYYLAESQYQIENFIAARAKFTDLVGRRDPANLTLAIRRLIEIADRTRDWRGLDARVSVLRKRGKLPPSVAYIHTKSLLRQGKGDAVEAAASDVPIAHPMWAKTRYLVGVAKLQAGDTEAARQIYLTLTDTADKYDDAAALRELAIMNRARIYMEEGALTEAVDAYQNIGRRSAYFEESLFEITWTYVRAADGAEDVDVREREYVKALKALEILLLGDTNTMLAPEARILLGNILLRLRRYDEATAAFNEVVARYGPVRKELSTLTSDDEDPARYYDEISQRSRSGGGLLPPLAIKWAAEERGLQDALGVVKDIDQGETWVEESRVVVDKLLAILNSEKRAQFFPALQDAQANLLELDNTLVNLTFRLLQVERDLVEDELDPARSEALEAVIDERAELEPRYRKLPQKREDYEGRVESMKARMQETQKNAYRLKWEVEDMRRQVDGIRTWAANNPDAMDAAQRQNLDERLAQADREVVALESEQAALETEIAKEQTLISITTEEKSEEDELRTRYLATLEREREILSAGAAAVTGENRQLLTGVEKQRSVLSSYYSELSNFKTRLAEIVGNKAFDIKAQLLKEQSLLEEHSRAVDAARNDAKTVVGEIALDSLRGVQDTFQHIVLRGDVGIVDVAWQLKEEQTHEISRRVNEQRKEIAVLDAEFKGIMKE